MLDAISHRKRYLSSLEVYTKTIKNKINSKETDTSINCQKTYKTSLLSEKKKNRLETGFKKINRRISLKARFK